MPESAMQAYEEVTPPQDVPLMKAINSATRSQHARLNQLILSRLPLALPPHSTTPHLYAQGLIYFASIYHAFESAWQILSDYEPISELPLELAVVLSSLIHLQIPTLPRSERLMNDLCLLLDLPSSEIAFRIRHPSGPRTREFVAHIRNVARKKPHALIAYSWVLYMALFNGGRWIREQLCAARDITWPLSDDNPELAAALAADGPEPNEAGLTFWHFEGSEDGDDIKAEYKARLTDVGSMLSASQKAEIVDEAKQIFERCAGMVEELDEVIGAKDEAEKEALAATRRSTSAGTATESSRLMDFLSIILPVVIMQLLMLVARRISGTRIRAPLPFQRIEHERSE